MFMEGLNSIGIEYQQTKKLTDKNVRPFPAARTCDVPSSKLACQVLLEIDVVLYRSCSAVRKLYPYQSDRWVADAKVTL
jgi:hypothetical protein